MFKLLTQKRFGPLFGVQFLGALNDNLLKNTMVILIAFKTASEAESGMLINLAAGIFILPFFLFSAVAGQITDKFEKTRVIRFIKLAEIGIMAVGTISFLSGLTALLFVALFLMGVHSAFFGPAKYSILPQHLSENELTDGNAMVEMGTFLAILIGTLAGGLLAGSRNVAAISAAILAVATLGYWISRSIPTAPAMAPDLKLRWNPFTETVALTRIIRRQSSVFNSILGISWFWYFGATLLAQLPNFTRHALHGNETVVTALLCVFSISIGVGSALCSKLSRGDIELGLVPIGALGMTLFTGDLFFIDYTPGERLMGIHELLHGTDFHAALRATVDLGMTGVCGSLFIVPLYAMIQTRPAGNIRSRVIAANNIFNAAFMVASALITTALFKAGLNTLGVLLVTALLNFAVCAYICTLIPEFLMRFVVWVLASTIYRMRYAGRSNIPRQGPAVLVCNHVSFIDWFVVTAGCGRPVVFIMDHNIYKRPLMNWAFRLSRAIPIAPASEDPSLREKTFAAISRELRDDNLVCIFPEGKVTYDGNVNPFKRGVEHILATDQVPVIPMAIHGLWGSFFSRKGGQAMHGMPKPSRRTIGLTIGGPLPPTTKAEELQVHVSALLSS
jgi:1-acyl-sn-glycerol-3-phosphate acyltransferase